jgi:aminoglycoside phosphotransferase (APT) family kinase protein
MVVLSRAGAVLDSTPGSRHPIVRSGDGATLRPVGDELGPLLARGRDGDIFEFGTDRVLRRARDGRSIEHEARIMDYLGARGFSVPAIHEVRAGGTEIVMDRVVGPTMLAAVSRRPWTLARHARVLADLHRQLHEIDAPDWLPQLADGGDRVVHLDLHPLNVLYGPRGPVLIDWTNAARGRAETDLAQTWLIVAAADTSDLGFVARFAAPLQAHLAHLVIREFDRDRIVPFLRPVAESRARDRHVRPGEVQAMHRLTDREERRLTRRAPTR